jgi:hypothetical protein
MARRYLAAFGMAAKPHAAATDQETAAAKPQDFGTAITRSQNKKRGSIS